MPVEAEERVRQESPLRSSYVKRRSLLAGFTGCMA